MAKYYCPSCGGETAYTFNLPNFCGACGTSRNAVGNFAATQPVQPLPQRIVAQPQQQAPIRGGRRVPQPVVYDEPEYIPDLDKLDIILPNISLDRGVRVADIAVGRAERSFRPKGKKTSQKQFLQELQEQAGSAAKSIEIGDVRSGGSISDDE